ncbi:NAD+ synthase [candidate division WOR-3 bacterium]|uniref:Glutamine-dependent NAD(+) synthetase n=1 Tax=candidate division WOR-3 bacterium TaxID=2052148 RepID=A0A938BNP0_UNCW3|nr:NAD+ synthase [candidate division WOR-3 bacterium]
MRIGLAQLNPVVGDLPGNVRRVQQALEHASESKPDLVVFSELMLTGYPPRDLLARSWFIDRVEAGLADIARISERFPDIGIIIGAPVRSSGGLGKGLHNAAILFVGGRELSRQAKSLLPTYDVFDETRYFAPAEGVRLAEFRGERIGMSICEDAWNSPEMWERAEYQRDPVAELASAGATLMVNISASPFAVGKEAVRKRLIAGHAARHHVPFVFVNQVGGNDELVFDGRSMAFDRQGRPQLVMASFQEGLALVEAGDDGSDTNYRELESVESIHDALVLGLRDYVRKCGFTKVVLGLSGGIDSAVVCCLAASAIGPENVLGITMPSEYSSRGSVEDSRRLADNLGIEFREVGITGAYHAYLALLEHEFTGRKPDATEENIQARVRGNILMAVSNKLGHLVLATGNKSELAVGYCTLYGDMSGGLCVLADVPKTTVYSLADHINRRGEVIPAAVIRKPPSAELRPDQTDQDTLPPYDVLDAVIAGYVDEGLSADQIVASGLERKTVEWVIGAVNRNEYKRRQAAPGLKVTSRAFGTGWRMPIAARY